MKLKKDALITRTRSRTTKPHDQPTRYTKIETSMDLSPSSSQHSSPPINSSRKRKLKQELDCTMEKEPESISADPATPKKARSAKKMKTEGTDEEQRLRRFRAHAPATYLQKLERATSQRMFVISRARTGTKDIPEETVEMAGTTGNIYTITIGLVPSCTCPDNLKGNQCKHIVYVLHNVLKAPAHLQYQLAFLTPELRSILSSAPPLPPSNPSAFFTPESPSNRKPIEGDCPICYTEFEPEGEEIVYCKAACGNNVHKHCFEQWAMTTRDVKCVYCRTSWEAEAVVVGKGLKGKMGRGGYVNVAEELGLSGTRDTSTYHFPWRRYD